MATYLDGIVVAHRERAAQDSRHLGELLAQARSLPEPRPFRRALLDGADEGIAVIAEIKRRSPSKGALNASLDPATMARSYQAGGASCLSVLTDVEHFGGSPDDLRAARAACRLPVLRKDFTVDPRDVVDARLMGADAVLLIVAALDDHELVEFAAVADDLGMAALVEVHDRAELERTLALGVGSSAETGIIGVNQRDLSTFEIDRHRALVLAAHLPAQIVRVAESGIRDAHDTEQLVQAGYHAVLVGESLVTSSDPSGAVGDLRAGLD